MEKSKSEMRLQLHGTFNPKSNETYIGLIDVSRIPFHLLVISGGKQYSWEVKKLRNGENVKTLIRHLDKKQSPSVFLKISESESTLALVEKAYSNPDSEETCIGPIIKLIKSLGVELNQTPLTIFELMNECDKPDFKTSAFGLNLNSDEVQLTQYSRDDVDEHLSQILAELSQ
jgi:hypothetical protein